MERTQRLICVGAVLAGVLGAEGCKFMAGVKDDTTGSGGSGGVTIVMTGGAGTTGLAGTLGGAGMTGAAGAASGMPTNACTNLQCQQSTCRLGSCAVPACPGGARTTVSGQIFDPAGKTPLYNITVFVPNAPLDDIKDGPSCDPCDPATGTSLLSGQPIVVAKTDVTGTFHLGMTGSADVPAGTDVPLVIQVGKWRRKVTIPTVTACIDNPITDMDKSRLPRNQAEGHIPKTALTTGAKDAMECLLRKIGIDDAEFTPETGTGRVNLYAGGDGASAYGMSPGGTVLNGGASFTPASPWWDSLDNLKKYDIILHSCDGSSYSAGVDPVFPKSMAARQALNDFADLGGRVFASHWHAYWFENGTDAFKSIGTFDHEAGLPDPYDATIDQSFDTGKALAQWMLNVGGSTMLGVVSIAQNASARLIASAAGGNISQRWIYGSDLAPPAIQFLSATTPIPGGTCGRAVISDLHVSAGTGVDTDLPGQAFPTGCVTTTMSPREKVLEFMLFDIASCVQRIIP